MMSSYDNWKTRNDRDEGSGYEPLQEADEAGDAEDERQQKGISKKLETVRLTHEFGKVTVHLYYWDNSEKHLTMTEQDFITRLGL